MALSHRSFQKPAQLSFDFASVEKLPPDRITSWLLKESRNNVHVWWVDWKTPESFRACDALFEELRALLKDDAARVSLSFHLPSLTDASFLSTVSLFQKQLARVRKASERELVFLEDHPSFYHRVELTSDGTYQIVSEIARHASRDGLVRHLHTLSSAAMYLKKTYDILTFYGPFAAGGFLERHVSSFQACDDMLGFSFSRFMDALRSEQTRDKHDALIELLTNAPSYPVLLVTNNTALSSAVSLTLAHLPAKRRRMVVRYKPKIACERYDCGVFIDVPPYDTFSSLSKILSHTFILVARQSVETTRVHKLLTHE